MVLVLYRSIKRKKHVSQQCSSYSSDGKDSGKNSSFEWNRSSFERRIEESLKLITTRMDLIEYKINHLNK